VEFDLKIIIKHMHRRKYPILEFDSSPEAIIEPQRVIKPIEITKHCVVCFFQDVITKICRDNKAKIITNLKSEIGPNPVYEINVKERRLAIFHPGVGASLAAGFLEEVIALGCKKFITCGGAGVLDKNIVAGHIIVPSIAVRDEGTSYHYLPAAREVKASSEGVAAIEKVLKKHHINYIVSKTWTTDGLYRETPAKIQLRKSEGCLTVEMETAALFAVARFRNVVFAQILYGGDDVSGSGWNPREWYNRASVREKLFWLAAEACLSL
jgi:uridine phosphorylase